MRRFLLFLIPALPGCFDFGVSRFIARPRIVATQPADGDENVTSTTAISVTFSKAMDPDVTRVTGEPRIDANVVWDQDGTRCNLQLTSALTPDTRYLVSVEGRDIGGALFVPQTFAFTTAALTTQTPRIVSTTPQAGSVNVALDTGLVVRFSLPMAFAAITTTPEVQWGAQSWDDDKTVLTIARGDALLPEGTLFTVGVTGSGSAGEPLGGNTSITFQTLTIPDVTRPVIANRSPADGAALVPRNATISIGFSEAMRPETITLSVSAAGGAILCPQHVEADFVACDPGGLPATTGITASIAAGAMDLAGNLIDGPLTHGFSTSNGNDVDPPALLSATPPDGTRFVSNTLTFDFVFSEPMDEAATAAALQVSGNSAETDRSWQGSGGTRHLHWAGSAFYGAFVSWSFAASATDLAGLPVQGDPHGEVRVKRRAFGTITAPTNLTGHCNGPGGQQQCYLDPLLYTGDYYDNVVMRSLFLFEHSDMLIPSGTTGVVFNDSYVNVYLEGCVTPSSQLGNMIVQGVNYGPTLTISDYGMSSDGTHFTYTPAGFNPGWKTYNGTKAKLQTDWDTGVGHSGFRMLAGTIILPYNQVAAASSDGDNTGDYCNFGSGIGANVHPPSLYYDAFFP